MTALGQVVKAWRLYRAYKNWYELLKLSRDGSYPSRVELWDGICLCSPPDNQSFLFMVKEVFFQKIYNPPGYEIGAQDLVVDVGANIGVFSIFAARKTRNHVFAFEPSEENYRYLMKNCCANQMDNVIGIHAAIAGEAGEVKLYDSGSSVGYLIFDHNIHGKLERYMLVKAITLAEAIKTYEIGQIDFLKMDCEGAEGDILLSIPQEELSKIRKIAMEFHDNVSSHHHDEILKLLRGEGFSTIVKWDGESPFGYLYAKR